jgi:hypothetical protein
VRRFGVDAEELEVVSLLQLAVKLVDATLGQEGIFAHAPMIARASPGLRAVVAQMRIRVG